MVFTTTLLVVLLAAATLRLVAGGARRPSWSSSGLASPALLVAGQLLLLGAWQVAHIRAEEYNVDESTWIADALAVLRNPHFFSTLLTHTTARPLTVLPLLGLGWLQLPISFFTVKVVALLLICLALWLAYLALRHLTSARFAALALLPLTVFYLVVQFDDFLAYNSELVCNVLVATGLWLYGSLRRGRDRAWQGVLAGLALGLIPFAKFQAIPGALVVAGFCLYEYLRARRWGAALGLAAAGLLPIAAAVGYCLLTGQLTVLIRDYFLYYFHYSYQYSAQPVAARFAPRDVLFYYRKQYTFAAYWFGLVVLAGAGLWRAHRAGRAAWASSALLLAALLWALSIYETIQSGTHFEHYLSLVLLPHTLLVALLLHPAAARLAAQQPAARLTLVGWGYAAVGGLLTFFSRTTPFDRGYAPPLPYDAAVVALIKQQCGPRGRVAIWGWADRYYVLSGVAPATRYANSVFQLKPNAQQAYYLNQYAQDLQQHPPALFIDAVADQQFTYDSAAVYGHERYPRINQIIAPRYQLIYAHDGLRAYRLKPAAPAGTAPRAASQP